MYICLLLSLLQLLEQNFSFDWAVCFIRYFYRLFSGPEPLSTFEKDRAWHVPEELNIVEMKVHYFLNFQSNYCLFNFCNQRIMHYYSIFWIIYFVIMQKACSVLTGHHDFSSFRASGCQVFLLSLTFILKIWLFPWDILESCNVFGWWTRTVNKFGNFNNLVGFDDFSKCRKEHGFFNCIAKTSFELIHAQNYFTFLVLCKYGSTEALNQLYWGYLDLDLNKMFGSSDLNFVLQIQI